MHGPLINTHIGYSNKTKTEPAKCEIKPVLRQVRHGPRQSMSITVRDTATKCSRGLKIQWVLVINWPENPLGFTK